MTQEVRLEKKKKAEETLQKKEDVEAENRVWRLREGKTGMMFEGALTGQKLLSLRDIAWTLGLTETGTHDVLIARISDHFNSDENGSLKDNGRYIGLFSRHAQKWKALDEPPLVVEAAMDVDSPLLWTISNTGLDCVNTQIFRQGCPQGGTI
jgi:hypothetical protein